MTTVGSTAKINKACSPCRQSKIKCTGGDPCERCSKSQLECVYAASKPRSKPNITKPKFYRLQLKANKLNSTFNKVNQYFKLSQQFNLSTPPSSSDSDNNLDFLYSNETVNTFSSINFNSYLSNVTPNINLSERLVVGPTIQNVRQQFIKLLIEIYETQSCFNFGFKTVEALFNGTSWNDSLLANAILAMALRIYQTQNVEEPTIENPFYDKARFILSQTHDVNTVECAQTLILFSHIEMGIGLISKSAISVHQSQRIAVALGLDQICYEKDRNFSPENIQEALIWLHCLSIDRLQTCDMNIPLITPEVSIQLNLLIPNFQDCQLLLQTKEFQYFMQMKIGYCVSTTLAQLKILSAKLENPKYNYCQLEIYNELVELYERLKYYESTGWFFPSGYTIEAHDYLDIQMLFGRFERTLMLKCSYIHACEAIQRVISFNPDLVRTPQGFSNPFLSLHQYQDCFQKHIMDVINLFYRLKHYPTYGFSQIDKLLCISTPCSAYAFSTICQYLIKDLSPFGRSCFEFCYLEAKERAKVWLMIRLWVQSFDKHYKTVILKNKPINS